MNTFIFGRDKYRVIAAVVVARTPAGNETYVNRHGILPANTSQGHIEYLLENGMIRKVEEGQS